MKISLNKKLFRPIFVGMAFTTLLACGSGDVVDPDDNSTTNVLDRGVVSEDTDVVVRQAGRTISSNLGVNMNSIEATANNSEAVDSLVSDDYTNESELDPTATEITSGQPFDDNQAVGHEQTLRDFVLPTLEGGNAVRTRTGNIIAIDPDESYVCNQWGANDLIDSEDIQNCTELLNELTVSIDAYTDDTGKLTYLYSNLNLLVIDYGPENGSYELFFPAVKALLEREAVIAGEQRMLPEVLEGSLKISATVVNSAFGAESGAMSVAVNQPVRLESAEDGISFRLGRTSAFNFNTDAATGEGKLSITIAAMVLSMTDTFGTDPDSTTTVDIPDFTTNIELRDAGDEVLVTNTGFGLGPMTIELDNRLIMSLALAKTSALFGGDNPTVTLLENLGLDLKIPDLHALTGGDFAVDSTAALALSTLAGTVLRSQDNGSVKVENGGPFNVEYSFIDGVENAEGSLSVLAGECVDGTSGNDYLVVSCE